MATGVRKEAKGFAGIRYFALIAVIFETRADVKLQIQVSLRQQN